MERKRIKHYNDLSIKLKAILTLEDISNKVDAKRALRNKTLKIQTPNRTGTAGLTTGLYNELYCWANNVEKTLSYNDARNLENNEFGGLPQDIINLLKFNGIFSAKEAIEAVKNGDIDAESRNGTKNFGMVKYTKLCETLKISL